MRGHGCDVGVVNVHSSARYANNATDGVKQSGLADTRRARDRKCFAGGNNERDIVHDDGVVERN